MKHENIKIETGIKKEKIEKDTMRIAQRLSRQKRSHVGMKTRFMFKMMAGMQAAGWGSSPMEKEYWEKNGWLGKERPWK